MCALMVELGTEICPCGLGKPYSQCCEPFHQGKNHAETAEQLMRSRYTAYVKHLDEYLLRTWAESTRPVGMDVEEALSWQKLTVLKTKKGRQKDKKGWVTFCAEYQIGLERFKLVEKSEFKRDDNGHWVYVEGEFE